MRERQTDRQTDRQKESKFRKGGRNREEQREGRGSYLNRMIPENRPQFTQREKKKRNFTSEKQFRF